MVPETKAKPAAFRNVRQENRTFVCRRCCIPNTEELTPRYRTLPELCFPECSLLQDKQHLESPSCPFLGKPEPQCTSGTTSWGLDAHH